MSYLHDTLGHSRSSSSKFIGFPFYKTEWYFSYKDQRITGVWKYNFEAQIFQIFVVTPKEITLNVKVLLHSHFNTGSKYLIVSQSCYKLYKLYHFSQLTYICLGFYYQISFLNYSNLHFLLFSIKRINLFLSLVPKLLFFTEELLTSPLAGTWHK